MDKFGLRKNIKKAIGERVLEAVEERCYPFITRHLYQQLWKQGTSYKGRHNHDEEELNSPLKE